MESIQNSIVLFTFHALRECNFVDEMLFLLQLSFFVNKYKTKTKQPAWWWSPRSALAFTKCGNFFLVSQGNQEEIFLLQFCDCQVAVQLVASSAAVDAAKISHLFFCCKWRCLVTFRAGFGSFSFGSSGLDDSALASDLYVLHHKTKNNQTESLFRWKLIWLINLITFAFWDISIWLVILFYFYLYFILEFNRMFLGFLLHFLCNLCLHVGKFVGCFVWRVCEDVIGLLL